MLKPVDIQNHTLRTSMRGYDRTETDDFLASVAESYEEIIRENRDLQDKIASLSEGIQYYKQIENTLQKALVLAEKTSSETQETAKIQADNMVKEAQEKADNMVREAQEKADSMVKEAQEKADSITKETEKNAESIIEDAKADASRIQAASKQECDAIKAKSLKLIQEYEDYREQLKKLVLSQLDFLQKKEFNLNVSAKEEDELTVPKEKFSWNNGEYKVSKTPETSATESGFTFIDTE